MAKRIIFPEKGKVALENFEPAELGKGDIKVQTIYSLMSIGTESIILNQNYEAGTHFARMFSFPQLKTGVQALGRVVETAEDVEDFSTGDVVYMREAHGSHQVLPAAACSMVPAAIDLKQACWAGLAKTAFRAAWAGAFNENQHVLVIGAGPVGQMTVRWAAASSVKALAVADISGFRLEHARRGGASKILPGDIQENLGSINEMNSGNGPELVIDTTGNAGVFQQALLAAGKFARVILLGDSGYPSRQCLSSEVMVKGLTIQATHDSHDRDGWDQRKIDAHFFSQVESGSFKLDGLITHEFLPEQCVEAYAQANQNREETMGLLFDWTQENF